MEEAPPPRRLNERTEKHYTEKHYCVKCLEEVPRDQYFENDFFCDQCASAQEPPQTMTDER